MAILDILPTNDRIHRIAVTDTDRCSQCGQIDTLEHRLTDCGVGKEMWRWTRVRLAALLRTNATYIPDDWTLHPSFSIWPPQRHGAILWILPHFVYFRMQHHATRMHTGSEGCCVQTCLL